MALVTAGMLAGSATLSAPAFADDPIAGPLTSGDIMFPNQGNGGYDALHYDINLTVNVAVSSTNNAVSNSTVPAATTTMTAQTTGAPLSSFGLDFQGSTGNLAASTYNVDSVTVNGVPASFTRIENTTASNAMTDNHKLIITPATPVSGNFTTVITTHGSPVRHTDADASAEGWNNTTDGATFVNQPVGSMTLFPNNDTPHDLATYTWTVNAPTTLTTSNYTQGGNAHVAGVVSNGELVSKTPIGDGTRTSWVWNETHQMASELTLLSIGRYDMYTSNLALASGRTIPEWTFIDPAQSLANQTTTLSTRAQMKQILDFYETKYGPYPGQSFGVVSDVVPSAINYALETVDRPFFPGSVSRGTFYHETMHQWWGDGVAPTVWNDIPLNEGPATYAESQLPYESAGSTTTSTETAIFNLWNNAAANNSAFAIPPANNPDASQLFSSQVYNKGAMALEALRTSIGAGPFETLMRQYQLTYGSGQIDGRRVAAFEALAESISGRDLTAFFQTWYYTAGKPIWPSKYNLNLAGPTTTVNPGDAVTYTASVRNTGKVAFPAIGAPGAVVISVDLSDVLDDATIGTLPANTTLSGTTLTWTVPATALAATSTVAIPVTINGAPGAKPSKKAPTSAKKATTGTLSAVARAITLGSTCLDCSPSIVIGTAPISPAPLPTITGGTPTSGVPLTADTTGWASGTTFAYQWYIDGTPVPGATSATYTPDGNAVGFAVTVKVTGTLAGFNTTSQTSAPTAVGVRGTLSIGTPTISGTAQAGQPLTVDPGTWTPGTYFTYAWNANGNAISGATGPIYTPLASQAGNQLTVTITGTKFGYTTATKVSAGTASVAAASPQVLTPTPTLSGTPVIGAPYIPVIGQWDDGTALTFQWSANGTAISGATTGTFTPTTAQFGKTLTLTVTSTKLSANPTAVTKTSASSAAVVLPAPTGVTARAGTAHVLVSWVAPTGSPTVTGYTITETAGDSPGATFTSAAGTTSKDITGLVNGTAYTFTVQAVSATGTSPASSPSSSVVPRDVGGEFLALTPARLLDTRVATGLTSGAPVGAGTANQVTIPVLGQGGLPASGVRAVVLNLTAVNNTAQTFVSALTDPATAEPTTSNLNLATNAPAKAVQVTVPVASNGTITLFNHAGTVDLIADIDGYYQDSTGFLAGRMHVQTAQRLLDTRSGQGLTGGTPARLGAQQSIDVQVTGNAGVPAGATSVVMNLTGVYPTDGTFIRATSSDDTTSTTSSLNLGSGTIVANLVTVPLSTTGKVRLFNHAGTIDLVADVVGYVTPASDATGVRYVSATNHRVLDTRTTTSVGPGQTVETAVDAPAGATGALIGLTSVTPTLDNYLAVNPAGTTSGSSSLNSIAGDIVSNSVLAALANDGPVSQGVGITNSRGTDDVLVDVEGYFIP